MTTEDRIQLLKDIRVNSPYVDEDKRLLLNKDICGRLPYGVMGLVHNANGHEYNISILGGDIDLFSQQFINIKPYLRSMSSMTEEEWEELKCIGYIVPLYDGCFGVDMRAYCKNSQPHYRRFSEFSAIEDWLNKNMFDYRGLIPMGLALEAPEGMYN